MVSLTLEAVRKYVEEGYQAVPISKVLYADHITPIELLKRLKAASKQCYLLESAKPDAHRGRYTFLGYHPVLELNAKEGVVHIKREGRSQVIHESIESVIRTLLKDYKSPKLAGLPPFTGGLVGYFSYDYIRYVEKSLRQNAALSNPMQDVSLMLFDKVICFDHYQQKIMILAHVKGDCIETSYEKALLSLDEMTSIIMKSKEMYNYTSMSPLEKDNKVNKYSPLNNRYKGKKHTPFKASFDEEKYCQMVQRAKQYITEGDIFQVVLSNRLEATFEGSLLDTYRVLRTTNPSPYMVYFETEDIEIAGASPETLVKLEDGTLYTFPLAGTRKRGESLEEDQQLEAELLADEKECAEHNMLVDLGRNDIGRVSAFGSVAVASYKEVHRYSHVMHIGSTVTGRLAKGKDAVDAIRAILPAGTLSGAPKIRACQIIDTLETVPRGLYGGAIGYIDFTGNLDLCIAIRMAYKVGDKVYIRAGAGIVADSDPHKEYEECLQKARAVVNAMEIAEGGI